MPRSPQVRGLCVHAVTLWGRVLHRLLRRPLTRRPSAPSRPGTRARDAGVSGGRPRRGPGHLPRSPPRTAMPVGLHGDHGWGYENGALGARRAETLLPPACLTCSLSLAHVGGFASLGTLC